MEKKELDNQETNIEDLTVSEDTADEVKGSYAAVGECTISSFNFMKKTDN